MEISAARKRVHGYTHPNTEVRPSGIDKLGLFASRAIQKGTVVAAWGGRVITTNEIRKLEKPFRTNYALKIYPGFYIAETTTKELDDADFINHSCTPNCKIINLLVMIAKRKINAGEELTADFDEASPKIGKKTRCRCGASACKGLVYF